MKFKVGDKHISISDKAIKSEKTKDGFISKYGGLFSTAKMSKEKIEETLGNAYDSFHPKKAARANEAQQ